MTSHPNNMVKGTCWEHLNIHKYTAPKKETSACVALSTLNEPQVLIYHLHVVAQKSRAKLPIIPLHRDYIAEGKIISY